MLTRETKALNVRKAALIKAVAHPLRVAMIDYLKDGEQCVCDIATHVGAERSNVSRHLGLMQRAGVLRSRKDGLQVYYELRTPCILNFLNCAMQALEQNVKEERRILTGK